MKKIKDILIKYRSDIIYTFILVLMFIVLIFPVPYYIIMGGGVITLDDKITINNQYEGKGTLNSAYVKQANGKVATYLLSYIIPSYKREKVSEVVIDEDIKSYEKRESIYFDSSKDVALIVAYKNASKKIKYKQEIYVLYIDKKAKTNLEVGDIIKSVNGISITNIDKLKDIISKSNDKINIELENGKTKYANIYEENGVKKIGIAIDFLYKHNIKDVKYSFSSNESGPSAGLMLSLSIYNKLTKDDITCGRKIVGTGTIDIEGNVGEIGGIEEKISGAAKNKADLFITPKENYEEAIKYKKEKNLNIKIIKVSTFEEAIQKLSCK